MTICIHWFRQDLRLRDNPALRAACANGELLPIYILDDVNAGEYSMGGASRWWLHYALTALNQQLSGQLRVYHGDAKQILTALCEQYSITQVYWNRCYEPWRIRRDQLLKTELQAANIGVTSYNASLLWEPWEVLKADGEPYKVFTPFYRKGCLQAAPPREPLPEPTAIRFAEGDFAASDIASLGLLPSIPWDKQLEPHWDISETGAIAKLHSFLDNGLSAYKESRNFPAQPGVSRLSPYLHWGQISPNQVWYAAAQLGDNRHIDHFLSELGWREFSYSLLYHFPELPKRNLQSRFDNFPWENAASKLQRWQHGQTGYPIVDAGMRELWQTGYMHNRIRMVVGSFLVKNLLLHWHQGEAWFWDCLVDADLASNSASWQWIAGCGADAAPYFRIFNPILQGQKFDPEGEYTRRYVPELAAMPNRYLFNPWEAPNDVLTAAGVKLGDNYPEPMVDPKQSREDALQAFKSLSG